MDMPRDTFDHKEEGNIAVVRVIPTCKNCSGASSYRAQCGKTSDHSRACGMLMDPRQVAAACGPAWRCCATVGIATTGTVSDSESHQVSTVSRNRRHGDASQLFVRLK